MKNFIYTLLILTVAVASGCNKFLDETPRDRLPVDQAYGNLDELYLNAVASLYSCVGGNKDSYGLQGTRRGIYDLNTFTTDEAMIPTRGTDWYDGGLWQGLYTHSWGTGSSAVSDTWTYLFQTILRCNKSIEDITAYQQQKQVDVSYYLAEVKALRAMFYFYAMDLYGRLPIIKRSEPEWEDLLLKNRSEVFNFIRSELQEAIPNLSESYSNRPGAYYSRMTMPVAFFILAKLALNAEVYTWDNWTSEPRPDGKNIIWKIDGKSMNTWEATVYYCDLLADMGYALEPDYQTNFQVENEQSYENIFTIPMDKWLYTNQFTNLFRSRHYNHATALGLNGENGSCATLEALDAFGYGTDRQDPRFDISYYAGEVYDYDGYPVLLDDGTPLVYEPRQIALDLSGSPYEKTAGARMRKYDVDRTATKDGNQSNNDIVLFRYADVLLMKAEALLRDSGPNDVSLALVNQVRRRVDADERTSLSLDDILQERLLELAWEGWRRNDMIRFDTFCNLRSFCPVTSLEADHHTIVFPMPGEFLAITGDKQNYGY